MIFRSKKTNVFCSPLHKLSAVNKAYIDIGNGQKFELSDYSSVRVVDIEFQHPKRSMVWKRSKRSISPINSFPYFHNLVDIFSSTTDCLGPFDLWLNQNRADVLKGNHCTL